MHVRVRNVQWWDDIALVAVTDLNARLAEGDAEAICILAVMLDQFLQRAEGGPAGDEESAFVKLSDAVMLHCVTVSHCGQYLVLI